jgi:uncharacterized protein YndB with AHSA1/START domain
MNDATLMAATRDIVVNEVFPHTPAMLWKALTTPEMMGRWLMTPVGFEPIVGNRFIYKTTPAGAWDGTIQCEVLEAVPTERLSYAWKAGHDANVGYGSPLDTVVLLTLSEVQGGTRLSLVHSGFQHRNDTAFCKMSEGWPKVLQQVGAIAGGVN